MVHFVNVVKPGKKHSDCTENREPPYFEMKKHQCLTGQLKLNFYYFTVVSKHAGVPPIKFSWLLPFQRVSVFFSSLPLCLLQANMISMSKSIQQR